MAWTDVSTVIEPIHKVVTYLAALLGLALLALPLPLGGLGAGCGLSQMWPAKS